MIVFDVSCESGHRFEGWFSNAEAFADQRAQRQILCPFCGSTNIERALSVPRIGSASQVTARDRDGNDAKIKQLAAVQREMLENSTWVGGDFARKARAMADGAEPHATIHGQATLGEAKSLHEDGIAVMPLPFPVIPPERRN